MHHFKCNHKSKLKTSEASGPGPVGPCPIIGGVLPPVSSSIAPFVSHLWVIRAILMEVWCTCRCVRVPVLWEGSQSFHCVCTTTSRPEQPLPYTQICHLFLQHDLSLFFVYTIQAKKCAASWLESKFAWSNFIGSYWCRNEIYCFKRKSTAVCSGEKLYWYFTIEELKANFNLCRLFDPNSVQILWTIHPGNVMSTDWESVLKRNMTPIYFMGYREITKTVAFPFSMTNRASERTHSNIDHQFTDCQNIGNIQADSYISTSDSFFKLNGPSFPFTNSPIHSGSQCKAWFIIIYPIKCVSNSNFKVTESVICNEI